MKKQICLLLLCIPLLVVAQEPRTGIGIKWSEGLPWEQVKLKAKQENKYIFIDCYASWCLPCKQMDKNIYPNDSIGQFYNTTFICVKVQFDSSIKDNDQIKEWYADADKIKKEYKIEAFPSFLYLSPNGELVNKATGYRDVKTFLQLGEDALNPSKQYSTMLNEYKVGKLDATLMPKLAIMAQSLGEQELSQKIASNYVTYLLKAGREELYSKANLNFIKSATKSSKDPGFNFLYENVKKINQLMDNPIFTQSLINYIISHEEIDPFIQQAVDEKLEDLDWKKIETDVANKYNHKYAKRNIIDAKIRWYQYKANWDQLSKNTALLLKNHGGEFGAVQINNYAWFNIFLYSSKKSDLKIAVKWVKKALHDNPSVLFIMDTYANLLYKVGKQREALDWEKRVLTIASENENVDDVKLYSEIIEKMKKRSPTWIIPTGTLK